ncbi:hypothetical protein CgunFtcFv8_002028 [Champsocephalus gunnari]|uniref:Thyrotropin receptor n=1 Tax=Champsocephalus gunnari TaxID=52237 RepID=A0AAN8CM14_CHAGU|nr:hypothetical protein CgunFtcFv8_002028 [Champsocephalus gunnari]
MMVVILIMFMIAIMKTASPCRRIEQDLSGVLQIPSNVSSSTNCLSIMRKQITAIPGRAFSRLQNLTRLVISRNDMLENINAFAFTRLPLLTEIYISDNGALRSIKASAFSDLPKLQTISIINAIHLIHIHSDAFKNITRLKHLEISNTGLKRFPNFAKIHSTAESFQFEMKDNIDIRRVPSNAFRGLCTQHISKIMLCRNGIKKVASDAFNGTKIGSLSLKGNKQLTHINRNAFVGSSELEILDISNTALKSLPRCNLSGLLVLIAESAHNLKKLPDVKLFTKLQRANLTYPSHCCPFKKIYRNGSGNENTCPNPKIYKFLNLSCPNFTLVTCTPTKDAFNPCEDIMSVPLRALMWIISVLALVGNAAVLLVLLGSRSKLTVPRFLMCHLAFSDLCMGIYLIIIATVDMLTRGLYYNWAIDWQTGLGCSVAGFFTVFASELSVFTLTAITLERWHTITHALRLDRKLRLRHACVVMTAGWIFSSFAALLPTVGVSSYGKVSICLPMDVESPMAQVYVVSLLLFNILAFFCVCGCYLSIYLTVRNPSSVRAHADTRVAKRMAVLIFTDFVCMAPISVFAVSAALKLPLITVSDAKLLLVLFYPINSCSNPFLYAFFTHTFRRDFFLLTARFGLFKTRAQIYRTESSSCQ